MWSLRTLACFSLLAAAPAAAADLAPGDAAAGRAYAVRACSDCHEVASRRSALFSLLGAPDFYHVANAKTTTLMGLNVFLSTPHSTMPNLIIADEDRQNVVSYIMSLREPRPATRPGRP